MPAPKPIGPPRRASATAALVSAAIAVSLFAAQRARCAGASEAPIKAAIILNIMRFVDFGSQPAGGALHLCVSRSASAARATPGLHGQRVGARAVAHRFLDPGDAGKCDVIYVGGFNPGTLARMRRPGVLLIGDGPGFIEAGGTIGLVGAGAQIRFEANTGAAREAGIRLSSRLLRLATRVR